MKVKCHARIAALLLPGLLAVGHAQGQETIGVPVPPLGAGPWVFDTAEQHEIRVSVVTRGLSHPWAIAFLPDGAMLITERPGRPSRRPRRRTRPAPHLGRAGGQNGR